VGAGAAGLGAALELQQTIDEVVVIDAGDRPGGVMRTDHTQGFVIERGPNTFQAKGPMLAALRRDALDPVLLRARPASRLRYVFHAGELVPAPLSPLALLRTPLLSARGKARLLIEPFVRRRDAGGESVAEFVTRRLGPEVTRRLVGPFLTGVYAGDEDRLGAEAVFGSLVDFERRAGSITAGAIGSLFGDRGEKGLRGVYSGEKGLGPLARSLAGRLREPPALRSRVTGLRREGAEWFVRIAGPGGESEIRSQRVVLATPSDAAAEILRPLCPGAAAELGAIEYAPVASVAVGVAPEDVRATLHGFGFLVPRDAEIRLLGCLYMSQLFPDRAPPGRELLQCMIGGLRWPEAVDTPDDVLGDRVRADLDRIVGLAGPAEVLTLTRYRRAVPQPGRDHRARMDRIRRQLADWPGLALAGSYVAGVGVADTFASGLAAARELLA